MTDKTDTLLPCPHGIRHPWACHECDEAARPQPPAPQDMRLCTLGVGCGETGVCYADAHNQPEQCGLPPAPLEGCMSGWEVAPAPQDDLRVSDALALEGYRAAVSFISADSWDGCSDCIEILRAARATDVLHYWTPNDAALAIQYLRSRYRGQSPSAAFDRATLALAPQDDALAREIQWAVSHDGSIDGVAKSRSRVAGIIKVREKAIIAERDAALAELAAAETRLKQAADNLEMGAKLYDCPGLEAAAKLARAALATEKKP